MLERSTLGKARMVNPCTETAMRTGHRTKPNLKDDQ